MILSEYHPFQSRELSFWNLHLKSKIKSQISPTSETKLNMLAFLVKTPTAPFNPTKVLFVFSKSLVELSNCHLKIRFTRQFFVRSTNISVIACSTSSILATKITGKPPVSIHSCLMFYALCLTFSVNAFSSKSLMVVII